MTITAIVVTISSYSKISKIIRRVEDQVDSVLLLKYNSELKKKDVAKKIISKKITLIETNQISASKRRNLGIKLTQSDLISFIDDDCLVDENWASEAKKIFETKKCAMLLGSVFPYTRNRKIGYFCPSTILIKKNKYIRKLETPWEIPGLGNNIWFKKTSLKKIGEYKTWLGLGSRCYNGEDLEMIIRGIAKTKNVFLAANCIVYHDRWLNSIELFNLNRSYSFGGIAAYIYAGFNYNQLFFREAFKEFKFIIAENIKKKNNGQLIAKDIYISIKCALIATIKTFDNLCKTHQL